MTAYLYQVLSRFLTRGYEQKLNGRAADRFPPSSLAGDDGLSEVGLSDYVLPTHTAVGLSLRLMIPRREEHCVLP